MNVKRSTILAVTAALLVIAAAPHSNASTNDRNYRFGDGGDSPAASNGSVVGTTFDDQGVSSMQQLIDLAGENDPVYRTITGRPDGVGGLGIEFDGSSSQYLRGLRLGLPEDSRSGLGSGVGTINYNGINNRGFQLWVQPGSASGAQSLVMDTNQHGLRINDSGNFSMRYAGIDFDSTIAATAGTWFHVEVVRPLGNVVGARMYVDGVAVVAASGGYDGGDTADLVIGSNTGGDDQNFDGGTEEFFTGILDDLTMFVIGDNSGDAGPPSGQDWGDFDFATDNLFAASTVTGLSGVAGDVDNDGVLDVNDKNDFISGWMNENLVNDIRIGDLNSLGNGDLNFDGITDIRDLVIIQSVLPLAGVGAITAADLNGSSVPEPSTAIGLLIGLAGAIIGYRRLR